LALSYQPIPVRIVIPSNPPSFGGRREGPASSFAFAFTFALVLPVVFAFALAKT
jgi:hypothetical protein